MKDKDRTEAIRGLLVKMKRDLQRYTESDKATPRIAQAKQFTINQIEEYVDNTEAWIAKLNEDIFVFNTTSDQEIARLRQHIFMLEAILLIHGVNDFPLWFAKGHGYLTAIAIELDKKGQATLPVAFKENKAFNKQSRQLWRM